MVLHQHPSRSSSAIGGPSASVRRFGLGALGTAIGLGLAWGGGHFSRPDPDTKSLDVAREVSNAFEDVAQFVAPAVVRIEAFIGARDTERPLGQGSGVILEETGVIATNAHVVRAATRTEVVLVDGRTFDAKILGIDDATDLAVLEIDADGLTALPLRDRDKPARVGEWVIAVGNPLGLGHAVTAGIVSGRGRAPGIAVYQDFIQTDAAINPGNSGGPLVDLDGNVLGINTAVADTRRGGQGIGFAIPASLIADVVDQLSMRGKVVRGYIGIHPVDLNPRLRSSLGYDGSSRVAVLDVIKDTPAEVAGLRKNEIIDALNGVPVTNVDKFLIEVARFPPGTEVALDLYGRDGPRKVKVTLGER